MKINYYGYGKKNDKEVDNYLNNVYFQNRIFKHFNNNQKLLNAFNYYKIVVAPLLGILYPVVAIIVPYLLVKFVFKLPIKFSSYYKLISSSVGGSIFPMASNSIMFKMSKILSSLLYIIFYFHNTYFSVTSAINTNKTINIIHNKMNSISNYIKTYKKLNNLLNDIIPTEIITIGINIESELFDTEPHLLSNKGV